MHRESDLIQEKFTVPSFKYTQVPDNLEYLSDDAIRAIINPLPDPADNLSSVKGFLGTLKNLARLLQ